MGLCQGAPLAWEECHSAVADGRCHIRASLRLKGIVIQDWLPKVRCAAGLGVGTPAREAGYWRDTIAQIMVHVVDLSMDSASNSLPTSASTHRDAQQYRGVVHGIGRVPT